MPNKVKVIPCSGIGKVHGLLARETALKIVSDCSNEAETLCLAYIVTGDQEIKDKLKQGTCITIDGCPLKCAAKSVKNAGGNVEQEYRVVDAMKDYRGAKPGSATALSKEGWKIVDETAEKISAKVKEILGGN